MKRILIAIMASLVLGGVANAQPAKSRVGTNNTTATKAGAAATAKTENKNDRAALMFPTAQPMPEDVVWKRDVYRQLDLMHDKNAPMYYPVQPMGRQVNLFTYLFRLIVSKRITAYTYKLDNNESFEEKDKLDVKDLLERYGIYYEEQAGKITVADSDVPSEEATRYYLKESIYLDQRTGTFHTCVTALCPVLMRGADADDEFAINTTATPYPLFWLKYADIAPWLAKLPMMGSNLNNVTNLTADDFFTLNRYEGKIYKTNNLQGKFLQNYCPTDSAVAVEQKRIEKQLTDFEEGVWGHRPEAADSTDSVSVADQKKTAKTQKSSSSDKQKGSTVAGSSRRRTTDSNKEKPTKSDNGAARASARRQRR